MPRQCFALTKTHINTSVFGELTVLVNVILDVVTD